MTQLDVHAPENDNSPAPSPPEAGVSPSSPLAKLRGKVRQVRNERVLERAVPSIPEIVVRFGTLGFEELERIRKGYSDEEPEETIIMTAAAIIAAACIGIYEKDENGELRESGEYLAGRPGEPLTFATLSLAEDGDSPEDEVRALYVADGDILSTQNAVLKHSGYDLSGLMEAIRGNS